MPFYLCDKCQIASGLKNFLLFCLDKEIIERMERLKMPDLPEKDMQTLELKDLHKVKRYLVSQLAIAEMDHDLKAIRNMKNMLRAYMMATQILGRLGSIWSLTLANIDMKKQMVHIRDNKELGWRNKCRKWSDKPMNEELYEFLKKDLAERKPSERYFLDRGNGEPWFYYQSEISTMASKIFKELGLPSSNWQIMTAKRRQRST